MPLTDWQQRFENWFKACEQKEDNAHDVAHLRRVWQTARRIMQNMSADELVVLAGCYFHDRVNLAKNHPQRHLASYYAAERTRCELPAHFPDFPSEKIESVVHCVLAHSFSAGIRPETIEAKIVQDADRLESLGAIGLARTFYVSGLLGSALFDSEDPFATERPLNDLEWALDHFQTKLLRLPGTMQTEEGRRMATCSARFLVTWMAKLSAELHGDYCGIDQAVMQRFAQDE